MLRKHISQMHILFCISAILVMCHLVPIPVHLDEYSLGLIGIMYFFCFLREAQIKYFSIKAGKEGISVTTNKPEGNTE